MYVPLDRRLTAARFLYLAGSLTTVGIGLAALTGWLIQTPLLTAFHNEYIPMAPSTALFFVVLGIALYATRARAGPDRVILVKAGLIVIVVILGLSLFFLGLSLNGVYLGVEHLGFSIAGSFGEVPLGNMSPLTALGFVLASGTMLLQYHTAGTNHWTFRTAIGSAVMLGFIAIILVGAYIAGGPILYGTQVIPPALTTSLGFLTLATGIIGVLVIRIITDPATAHLLNKTIPFRLIAISLCGAAAIIVMVLLWYRSYSGLYRDEVSRDLLSVVNLTTDRVVRWREERLSDGKVFYENPRFSRLVRDYRTDPDTTEPQEALQFWLQSIRNAYRYRDVALYTGSGALLLSAEIPLDYPEKIFTVLSESIRTALQDQRIILSDVYHNETDGSVHMWVIVPIATSPPASPTVALVLEIDPEIELFPLLQPHQTDATSVETLLVRREADSVVVLNAGFLRLSLDLPHLPPVVAGMEQTGVVSSRNIDGEALMGAIQRVPETPWVLVAQRSMDEVFEPLKTLSVGLAGLIVLFLSVLLAIIGGAWQRKTAAYYRELYEVQAAWHNSEDRLRRLFDHMSSGFAVHEIIRDTRGTPSDYRLLEFNAAFTRITGLKQDAIGRPATEILPGIENDPTDWIGTFGQVATTGESTSFEAYAQSLDRWLSVIAYCPERDKVATIVEDVTERRTLDQQRIEQQNLLKSMEKITGVGAWSYDLKTETITWTDGTYAIYEVDPSEFDPSDVSQDVSFYNETDQATVDTSFRRLIATGEPFDLTVQFVGARGTRRWVRTIGLPHYRDGKIAGAYGNILDITDQKNAERELAFQSTMLENIGEAIVVTDPAGSIVYWNDTATTMYGWSREEAVGRTQPEILPSPDLPGKTTEISRSLSAGTPWTGEVRVTNRTGSELTVLLTVTPVFDHSGDLSSIISITRDISHRKELERRYAGLFLSIRDAIVIKDTQRTIVDCNPAFSALFGYSLPEIVGQPSQSVYENSAEHDQIERTLETRSADSELKTVTRYRKRNGEVFRGETLLYRLRDSGENELGYIEVIHDLTDRELLEQELIVAQKMEALGQIAGGIAHDFNNVLTAISGAAQVLSVMSDDPKLTKYVSTIRSSVKRGISVTSRMVTFARTTEPEAKSIGLGSFLSEFQDAARHTIPQNVNLRIKSIYDSQRVFVDPAQFQQVLFTLVINAADAMPDGGEVRFEVRKPTSSEAQSHLPAGSDPESFWCLEVIDDGQGIDEQIQQKIFDPFFTTKDPSKGTGLGLPVAQTIIKMHNGWISVTSRPGQGTTFIVGLPVGTTPVEHVSTDDSIVRGKGETVLVVDDEEPILTMLQEVLSGNGYHVLPAANAGDALSILQHDSESVALVLTDVGLPDMNGKDLIMRIQALFPNIPIIAMTGYVDAGLSDSLYAVGANAVVNKPYDIHKLSEEIHVLIRETPK